MEPFHLTLSQVNVNEQELGESSAYENLYSFSNLVSFDSDFQQEEDTHAVPVIAKRLKSDKDPQSAFCSPDDVIRAQAASERYLHNFYKLKEKKDEANEGKEAVPSQQDLLMAEYRASKMKYGAKASESNSSVDGFLAHTNQQPRDYPSVRPDDFVVDANTTIASSGSSSPTQVDSFKSFTDTVEALALQQSVIGKKGLKPASSDEIEKVLEATRKRMLKEGALDSGSIASIAADVGDCLASAAESNPSREEGLPPKEEEKEEEEEASVVPDTPYGDDDGSMLICMTGGEETSELTKDLIRIPPEELITVVEKNSRWFSGSVVEVKSSAKHPYLMGKEGEVELGVEANGSCDIGDQVDAVVFSQPPNKEHLNSVATEVVSKQSVVRVSEKIHQQSSFTVCSTVTEPSRAEPHAVDPKSQEIVIIEPKNISSDALRTEVDRLLKEKAKLEGHIEVLEAECNAALRERAQLQSQVGAVTQQLKCQETSVRTVTAEREAISADYETLRQNRARLEQAIVDSSRLMQEKDEDLKTLHEDLRIAKEAEKGMKANLKELSLQLQQKEATMTDMKSKIADVYIEFQTAEQNRLLAESEIGSLKSEKKTLLTGKEWYMEQLSASQEAKNQLQHEITRLKSEVIASATLLERSRAESVRLQTTMKEIEQQALHEKEQLAKHLEAIEAEMLAREATFAQIQNERVSMESLLMSKKEKTDEETAHASDELHKMQNELRRHQAHVKTLEHQQSELNRRLTLSQESILQRDHSIESLEEKLVAMEVSLNEAKQDVGHKEADLGRVKEEKMGLEVELRAAREEKGTFDLNLQSLKGDMSRVETSFHQMKVNLDSKQQEIDDLKRDNDRLSGALSQRVVTAETPKVTESVLTSVALTTDSLLLEELTANKEKLEEERLRLRKHIEKLDEVVSSLRREKADAEQSLGMAEGRVSHMESRLKQLIEEKAELEGQLLKTLAGQASSDEELGKLREKIVDLEENIKRGKDEANSLKQHLSTELRTKEAKLSEQVGDQEQITQELKKLLEQTQSELTDERQKSVAKIEELKNEIEKYKKSEEERVALINEVKGRLEENEDLLRKERDSYEGKLEALMQQLRSSGDQQSAVHEMNVRLEQNEHQIQQERTEYEGRLQEMAKIIRDTENGVKVKEEEWRSHLEGVTAELEELRAHKERALEEEKKAESKVEMLVAQRTEVVTREVKELHVEISILREEKLRHEILLKQVSSQADSAIAGYRTTIEQLQSELEKCRVELAEAENGRLFNRELSLELEKERGRLAGLQQTYTSLKEHNLRVEAALSERESSVMELTSHADTELSRQNRELCSLKERLSEVEALREEDLAVVAQLKSQLTAERDQQNKVRRELEALQRTCSQLEEDLEASQSEMKTRCKELEDSRLREQQHKERMEKALHEVKGMRESESQLKREVEERSAKDPVQMDEIKTLQWQLSEKQTEVNALQEQVQLVNERQGMQMNSLQSHLQARHVEIQKLKTEMSVMKRDKNALQAKVTELKGALRVSVQHVTQSEGAEPGSDKPRPPFDKAALERLLKEPSSAPISQQSKPLSVLQDTLSGLRSQISSLQSQFNQHTSAVHNSSLAWKDLEAQVQDLREVCKSSAADRAASQSILESTLQLTETHNSS